LCAGAAVLGFLLFYRQEQRTARPIIDFHFFADPGFSVINAVNAALNLAAFAIMLLAPFALARIQWLSLPLAGLVLSASPFGMIVAAPLAGRLAADVAPGVLATVGAGLSAAGLAGVGLYGVGVAAPGAGLAEMVAAMAVQGFGIGLFQVAYFDMITAAIPARNRGVAGALGMATRSIGTVTGATVLMLVFQGLQAGGFDAAFRATFLLAATIPAVLAGGMGLGASR
jgi:MFS family permease